MIFDRFSVIVRSLRFRLMIWNAGAVALTGVATLFAVREAVRHTLVGELDEVLSEDLREIELFLQSPHYSWMALTEELNRKAQGHDFHRWFVQFYDRNNRPGWSSFHTPALPNLTDEQRLQRAFSVSESVHPAGGTRGATTERASAAAVDEDYRVSYRKLQHPLGEAVAVCVGCSQRYVVRDMAAIDREVLMMGLAVLAISPLIGHLLTNHTIRPLAQMIRTTSRLRPGELTQRVPMRGTGDELDSLAHTINGLLDRITDYLQQEHDFLANAAHDLRTPLAAIRSNVEVALSGTRSDEEYRELLGIVIEQCSALQTLVNQLLLLAESDADRLQIDAEPVALENVVASVADMFAGVAEDQDVELVAGGLDSARVAGKRFHLRQVISNLLDNAIKFTAARHDRGESANGPAGRVTVELKRDDARELVMLQVSDNGIGIDPEHLPHMFDRFYRGDSSRSRSGLAGCGTGLGLSICKAIVESHNGSIHVKSVLGEGTMFTVVLPLTPNSSASVTAT